METAVPITKFLQRSVIFVVVLFLIYAGVLIASTWPITTYSVDKAGTFGDSFGALTSLFTGLGFAGLLSTIYLQREELRLNRQELQETRSEIRLQSETFHRQRFEDAFYQLLSLYKENLRDLSIRPHDSEAVRIFGIEALNFLNAKFEKAWGKQKLKKIPEDEAKRIEYLYILSSTIHSIFVRQTRYVETLLNILALVEDECNSGDQKKDYWRVIASQLTAYEIKYLFYQAMITPEFGLLRGLINNSQVVQDRLAMLSIPEEHRKAFEILWNIPISKQRNPFRSPLSPSQVKQARKAIQKREKAALELKAALETEAVINKESVRSEISGTKAEV
ncbi:putative phage abortive infection protein [Comamonas thiooxydans]|uniref:putative phage abortive infection protein n=1 Tax=Comamonas thiooxydans TaxID=363952 RepID=UPI00209BEE34|nr:putative phage abortive infection protein [Comamonas thiooxydans]MCO8250186.1 hypothetical protein [Comamonas thiooxydans]